MKLEILKVISIIIFPVVVLLFSILLERLIDYIARRSVDKMMNVERKTIAKDFKLFVSNLVHKFVPSKIDHYLAERRIQKLLDKEFMKHKKGEYK